MQDNKRGQKLYNKSSFNLQIGNTCFCMNSILILFLKKSSLTFCPKNLNLYLFLTSVLFIYYCLWIYVINKYFI